MGEMLAGVPQALGYVVPFVALLAVIVLVHELGHFSVGRWLGMPVTTFSLGFGRELVGWDDRHGTHWRLALVPLGGYVRFTSPETAGAASFHLRPVGHRTLVVLAGPLANFLLAFLVYVGLNLFVGQRTDEAVVGKLDDGTPAAVAGLRRGDLVRSIDGRPVETFSDIERLLLGYEKGGVRIVAERDGRSLAFEVEPAIRHVIRDAGSRVRVVDIGVKRFIPPVIGEVLGGLPAARAGMRAGDRLISVEGRAIESFEDMVQAVVPAAERTLRFVVERDGSRVDLIVTPERMQARDDAGQPFWRGRIGVKPRMPEARPIGPIAALEAAGRQLGQDLGTTLWGLAQMFSGRQSAEQAAGPIVIAAATAEVAALGIEPILRWLAMLSANLGLLNLLPVPVLDGGHLVMFGFEAARRRPLSGGAQAVSYRLGLAVLLTAMAVINLGDLVRLGRWLIAG